MAKAKNINRVRRDKSLDDMPEGTPRQKLAKHRRSVTGRLLPHVRRRSIAPRPAWVEAMWGIGGSRVEQG